MAAPELLPSAPLSFVEPRKEALHRLGSALMGPPPGLCSFEGLCVCLSISRLCVCPPVRVRVSHSEHGYVSASGSVNLSILCVCLSVFLPVLENLGVCYCLSMCLSMFKSAYLSVCLGFNF